MARKDVYLLNGISPKVIDMGYGCLCIQTFPVSVVGPDRRCLRSKKIVIVGGRTSSRMERLESDLDLRKL